MTSAQPRSRRSAGMATYSSSSSTPPPPPPPGHPNQPVHAFTQHGYRHPDQGLDTGDSFNTVNQRSQSSTTQGREQQHESWADNSWRSIFDAALVKAQQAVQLDELGETTLAANLYAQAANDLGRVIPMCGSEKKKQSMLAIQAIYLDRVSQLKAGKPAQPSSSSSAASRAPQHTQETRYSFNNGRGVAYGQEDQYMSQENYQPQQQQQQQHQDSYPKQQLQQYQTPPPPPPPQHPQQPFQELPMDENEKRSKIFGKKRSKTQPSAPQPPEFLQQDNYSNSNSGSGNGYGSYGSYGEYNNRSNVNPGNGGYISPPYTAPTSSPSPPPVMVSPIFMTHMPSPTPPTPQSIEQQQQQQEPTTSSSKSSRWKPFGKKKSKSFSTGEGGGSGPYQPPNVYEAPSMSLTPADSQQSAYLHNNYVDPGIQTDLYSQHSQEQKQQQQQQQPYQQHPDWFVEQGESPNQLDDYEQHTRYYDEDEDGDVDPYYIADTKGRAHAFEGKDAGKIKASPAIVPVDDPKKKSSKKPTLKHNASSYSNEQSFTPTFASSNYPPDTTDKTVYYPQEPSMGTSNDQVYAGMYDQDYSDTYNVVGGHGELGDQQDPYLQPSFDYSSQFQHSPYSMDPSLMNPNNAGEAEQDGNENEKSKSKSKWFGKKKKKDGTVESFDEVAKLMDEALFGGGSSIPKKKNKDKEKEKQKRSKDQGDDIGSDAAIISPDIQAQLSAPPKPAVLPSMNSLTEHDVRLAHGIPGPSLDGERQRYYAENPDYQQLQLQQQQSASPALVGSQQVLYAPTPLSPQAPSTPKALMPIAYSPRTTYTPSPKKQLLGLEDIISSTLALPVALPELDTQLHQQQNASQTSLESPADAKSIISPDASKKPKNSPFNLFKSKKGSSKLSLDQDLVSSPMSPTFNHSGVGGEDIKSMHSDNTRKSSIQSNDRKAADMASAAFSKDNKKRASDEYVPYEYQEELEGPLMERVEVPESREIIGFVMPVEEIVDYNLEGDDNTAALDNWDSWVSQLESFEKVLSDNKGLKKGKKSKKSKKEKNEEKEKEKANEALAASTSLTSSPVSSLKADRSSIFSSSTGRASTSTGYDASETRPTSTSEDLSSRYSFHSTRSSAIMAHDLTVQQISVQQAKKRWWNPKRKETTSLYTVSDSFSVSEQDQEKYLHSLLEHSQEHQQLQEQSSTQDQDPPQDQLIFGETDQEREDALNALLENSRTIMSLPIPQVDSVDSSTTSTQEIHPVSGTDAPDSITVPESTEEPCGQVEAASTPMAEEEESSPAPIATKVKAIKTTKPKLLPISTPLAQLLQISNPEELWQYVQQAKTYASTRMNKGDKRSAAIALKRAQALEARWQEILLEMASSDEDEDELLDDDDEEEEEESEDGEEEQEEQEEKPKVAVAAASVSANATKSMTTENNQNAEPTAVAALALTNTQEQAEEAVVEEENDSDDEEMARRRMHVRKITSRSDSAPNMYFKYKVAKSAGPANVGHSENSLAIFSENDPTALSSADAIQAESAGDGACQIKVDGQESGDGRLGPDATMDQMLAATNADHLQFYIQRLKTDTVAKARSGSKFAALEGMKNVKVLQQRLTQLEEEEEEEEENEDEEDSDGEENEEESKTSA